MRPAGRTTVNVLPITICILILILSICAPGLAQQSATATVTARIGLVLFENTTGNYIIWMDKGKTDNITQGLILDVSIRGIPAGSLWIDDSLDYTSTGRLEPIRGFPGVKSGDTMEFTVRGLAVFLPYPEIKMPFMHMDISASADDVDKPLLEDFLKWTKPPVPVMIESPPAPATATSGTQPPSAESDKKNAEPDVIVLAIDPDIAVEIKSGYFVDLGDCLHISPWPGAPAGHSAIINEKQEIALPGGSAVSTKGKSILALERALSEHFAAGRKPAAIDIEPCRLKIPGAAPPER